MVFSAFATGRFLVMLAGLAMFYRSIRFRGSKPGGWFFLVVFALGIALMAAGVALG